MQSRRKMGTLHLPLRTVHVWDWRLTGEMRINEAHIIANAPCTTTSSMSAYQRIHSRPVKCLMTACTPICRHRHLPTGGKLNVTTSLTPFPYIR